MSSGWDEGAERFADACEQQQGDRRSPLSSTRRSTSGNARPARPDDPTMRTPALDHELRGELDIVAALREAARSTPGPDPAASARMRASVMASIGAPGTDTRQGRVLEATSRTAATGTTVRPSRAGARPGDGRPERSATGATASPSGRGGTRRRRTRTGRILNNVLTGTCVVMLLGALTVVMSRGALPGETLYGVKRASESVEMGLTTGQEARGRKHLDFAALRLDEVSGLIERGSTTAAGPGPVASGLDPEMAALVGENLREFDEQTRAGSRLMLPLSEQSAGPDPAEVENWAREQSTRLQSFSPSLSGEDRAAVASSQELLERLSTRATALDERRSCPDVTSGSDELGPLPADTACETTEEPGDLPPTPSATSPVTSTTTAPTETPSTTTDGTTPPGSTTTTTTTIDSPDVAVEEPTTSRAPAPVQVPLPVPLLPPVEVPPLLPGLPGLSLG